MTSSNLTRRWTSQTWFGCVLAGMVVLILAGAGLGTQVLADTTAVSNRLNDHISPARTTVVQLDGALGDQVSGLRAFAVSGRPELLEPYRTGITGELAATARLHELLADEAGLLAELDELERLAAQWRRDSAEPLIAARQISPAVSQPSDAFAAVRAQLTDFDAALLDERTRGRQALDDSRQVRNIVFLGLAALLLAAVAAIAVLLRLIVLRPLTRLSAAVRTVAAGDFGHRLSPHGPSDIAALGHDVDAMRERLVQALVAASETRDALARSNADLEQFAYVASHDLQEPLRKVASFCQMLQRRYAGSLDDRAQQYIAFAVDGATRMQRLITDLLTFSRIGRVYDSSKPVDLGSLVDQVEQTLAATIEETGARIDRPDLPTVQGDATLLAMLWQNLIGNALKFRHPDRPPHVTISAASVADEWSFTVSDNGIGVDAEFADKIFVIFQRLHPREKYSGTGIGLAICKRVVEHHGGAISVDTTRTDGTTFAFTIAKHIRRLTPEAPDVSDRALVAS
ncbi:histidine kinase [Actinoplanes italicus]|uniref:histidine kinase n=1 Tax=Actinoplanes italicus TaxID=113567 RepID=A0A2T0JXD3_9ACTN|nr:sensor histidine kinase [Actinoplanes italicus]PRX12664.1 phospho-acceptor domain-containing protein [Actinoplanes italicus]GIE35434.1 histidine kinase [Actinoplanes italicus]